MDHIAGTEHKGHRDYAGAKIGMWLFLLTEVFLFFGPFLLYLSYRLKYPAEFHQASAALDLTLGTVNTVILLSSSLTIALSIAATKKGSRNLSALLLGATIILGAVFLVNKYVEWGAKISHGIYPNSPGLAAISKGEAVFYGLYYFMTGLHGLHVAVGMAALSFMLYYVVRNTVNKDDFIWLENSGLYWHLVDVIWIYLFPFFYLVG